MPTYICTYVQINTFARALNLTDGTTDSRRNSVQVPTNDNLQTTTATTTRAINIICILTTNKCNQHLCNF